VRSIYGPGTGIGVAGKIGVSVEEMNKFRSPFVNDDSRTTS
jgi:glucokinase